MNLTPLLAQTKPTEHPNVVNREDQAESDSFAFATVFEDLNTDPKSEGASHPLADTHNPEAVTADKVADEKVPVSGDQSAQASGEHIKQGAETPHGAVNRSEESAAAPVLTTQSPQNPAGQTVQNTSRGGEPSTNLPQTTEVETVSGTDPTKVSARVDGTYSPDRSNLPYRPSPDALAAQKFVTQSVTTSEAEPKTRGAPISGDRTAVQVQTLQVADEAAKPVAPTSNATVAVDQPTKMAPDARAPDGTQTPQQKASTGTPAAPMSMLERHLGGHPVSLAQTAGVTAQKLDATHTRFNPAPRIESLRTVGVGAQKLAQHMTATPALVQSAISATVPFGLITQKANGADIGVQGLTSVEEFAWDPRSQTLASPSTQTAGQPRADMASNVVQQVAEAMRRMPDRPVEIALNPVELGKVRMVLSTTDAGITLTIQADRADTLDLMRRNIDGLGKSFADMGYEDISFSFSGGEQTNKDAQHDHQESAFTKSDENAAPTDTAIATPPLTPTLAIAPDGIDLRF